MIIDPSNTSHVYAGTDIGVYLSTDAGTTWNPFGIGLPRVAVFGMAITSGKKIRIATHGRGMWETATFAVLPVKWLSVTGILGTQKQAVINWRVQEENVEKYEIEKSTDRVYYYPVGTVRSKGDGENSYSFNESNTLAGTGYYRIRQTDSRGNVVYSSVVRLTTQNSSGITVYPVPAKDIVTISVGRQLLNTKMILADLSGRKLNSFYITHLSETINIAGYANGTYIMKFETGETVQILKQ
jgi:hypothetical protein